MNDDPKVSGLPDVSSRLQAKG